MLQGGAAEAPVGRPGVKEHVFLLSKDKLIIDMVYTLARRQKLSRRGAYAVGSFCEVPVASAGLHRTVKRNISRLAHEAELT